MKKQTYGNYWDGYVADAFPKLQGDDSRLTYPGEEWGNESSWQRIFEKLFVPAGVADWDAAIEIGGGGGKYTERVLRANDHVRVFGFDVSRNFLEATAARLSDFVAADRLTLTEIDAVAPDAMFRQIEQAGLARKLDAMFSIDAMVHVDLQYLFTYWVNAALALKPGGRVLMTLADPTTVNGFQKITRDIVRFYKRQGRICSKFEYLSEEIVRHLLTRLGFTVEMLEPWSYHPGRPARDLYLIARLDRPDVAATFREAVRADPSAAAPALDEPETYAKLWDRLADKVLADSPDQTPPGAVVARLREMAGLDRWQRAIEFSLGATRTSAALLGAAPKLRLISYMVSDRLRAAAEQRLPVAPAAGRFTAQPIPRQHADFVVRRGERGDYRGDVDAVVSVDTMLHVDVQYLLGWWINAALVLRPGGWIMFNVADPTTPAGFDRLVGDIRAFFPMQGQACARFEWQSGHMVRWLLQAIGFEIVWLAHWNPATGEEDGRDLWVLARLAKPQAAEGFHQYLRPPNPIVGSSAGGVATDEGEQDMAQPMTDEQKDAARALGQAYWRHQQMQANPEMTKEQIREQLRTQWNGARREYTKLGQMVLRHLERHGYEIRKTGAGED
jgi:cyclopropane fatty-acyl-phospholipid synthase-like methyltransferase